MNNIENVLIALSAGEIRGDLQKFMIVYGEEATEALSLESMPDFSFWDNGRSVIIYTGSQAVFLLSIVFYILAYNKYYIAVICFLNAAALRIYILFLR